MQNEQTVSLQGLMKWALEARMEEELADMPTQEELQAMYPDTSNFRQRVFSQIEHRKKESIHPRHISLHVLKKILLVAAIMVSILSCILMTSAAVRNVVANTIIDWSSRNIGIHYEMEGESLTQLPEGYGPHVIPERFILQVDSSSINELDNSISYGYESEDKADILDIKIDIAQSTSIYQMDNEHAEYEMVTFQGATAYVAYWHSLGGSEGYTMLWVKNGIEHYIYGTITLSELFEIAENIY